MIKAKVICSLRANDRAFALLNGMPYGEDSDLKEDYFKSYKYFKVVQLSVLVLFALAFFCFLYFDKDLHQNIYTNKSLLTICVFLWAFMIYSLASIVWDFKQLEGNIVHDSYLNRTAYVDSLTGIPNRYSCDQIFEKYGHGSDISKVGCALVSISNLKEINKESGRKQGNVILCDFSRIFERIGKKYGFVGRNSGNEFLFVAEESDNEEVKKFISDLNAALEEYNGNGPEFIEISTSFILNREQKFSEFTDLVAALYKMAKG